MHIKNALGAVVAFLALADAAPSNLEGRKDDHMCKIVKEFLGHRAISLCKQYLGQPLPKVVTVTRTTTKTNVRTHQLPAPTTSITVEKATTIFVTNRYTTYSEIPTTTSVSTVLGPQTTKYVYEAPSKRDVRDPDMRNCERKYGKKVLRSACECIWKPKQETRTTTTVKTRQTTTTVTKKPKSTKVVTRTITVPVTKQVEVTTTLPATSTVTIQTTTTVTPDPIIRPAICNAGGSPGPNAFNYDGNFNTNLRDCINTCKSDYRCYSLGFYIVTDPGSGQQRGTCLKYDKPVADSAVLGPGNENWYDKDCPAP